VEEMRRWRWFRRRFRRRWRWFRRRWRWFRRTKSDSKTP